MIVEQAIEQEPRMGASLLRLHFHDCFVNGCDGSVLLDDTPTFTGEKNAAPNKNSIRGFDVVDKIKEAVNSACNGNVVSCADILAVAARDSVVALGGPSYNVELGRRDSLTASQRAANRSIPAPTLNFTGLLSNFQSHGLSMQDLAALSGGHTLGFARCTSFRSRLYNETATLDSSLAESLKSRCPLNGGDDNLAGLDGSPTTFDTFYYDGLLQKKGLLHSDQQLYKGDGSGSDGLVRFYADNPVAFWQAFAASMLKMGSMKPLTGKKGEIRVNCRKVN
ncbi:peroxidase 4-like [Ananas comosus]|uniref:peroxidase n=2 Tax=Ananas comosus TaxID=4615 RepID=A0A6P5F1R3_ANACO|nr:peroxidase 4-like [Ananas comosus]